jgi:hypothetical protein
MGDITDLQNSGHGRPNGISSEPLYFNVNEKNNGLTRFAGCASTQIQNQGISTIRGGDSQHSCGEGECSDDNGFEVHIASVIKMKEVCS